MRILLSGGIKTQNIVSGIDKKFKASGDDFLVIEYMDDIMDIFSRGDYFDKAVITEQSITREYAITDESVIRRKINQFALSMVNLPKKYSYVFLTQTEQMAEMIHEEILPILNESAVVVKEPPYSVNFFVSIIVTDVNQLPPEIVFTPTLDIPDDLFDNDAEAELMNGMEGDDTEQYVSKEITKDFDTELFGPDIDKVKPVKNVLTLDNHNDILDIPEELKGTYEDEIEIEPEEEPEEVIIEEEPEEEMYMPNSSFGPIIDKQSDSSTLEFTNINPIKKSSELPDYDIGDEEPEYISQPDTGFIPGFDSDNDNMNSDMNTEYVGDTDMYNPDTSFDPYDTTNTQGFNDGFGEGAYGDEVYDPNNSMAGFDPGVYGEEDADKDYQDSMNEQVYDNQGPDGFNTQDYDTQSQ
ncbi:MAG: hypothetical protein J6A59_17070, partial [Lachnospiraceae bacterium]|nr:hypothetical protein [Lachnospiraceae bacterium]